MGDRASCTPPRCSLLSISTIGVGVFGGARYPNRPFAAVARTYPEIPLTTFGRFRRCARTIDAAQINENGRVIRTGGRGRKPIPLEPFRTLLSRLKYRARVT